MNESRLQSLATLLFSLLRPWSLLDFSWALLQSLLGLLFALSGILAGARIAAIPGHCTIIQDHPFMPSGTGVSLGPFLLGGRGFSQWIHEYGHSYQSRLLGPFYLIIIGLPSLSSVILRPSRHSEVFTERWADAWSPSGHAALRFQEIQLEEIQRRAGRLESG